MAANPSIQLGTDGNWAIKEDNLLAYKKDGTRFFNKEFDFTRGTFATFVDKDGLIKVSGVTDTELVTNGNFDTDSDWIKSTGWSISGGKAIATSAPSGSQLYQNGLIVGKKYITTFTITDLTSGAFRVLFGDGGNTSGDFTSTGTYTVIFTAAGSTRLGVRTVGTTTGSIDNISVKEIQTDVPRIDFTDDATGHLLLEPQSTNLVEFSEDFTDSSWNKEGGSMIQSNISSSPDGGINASYLKAPVTTNSTVRITYTFSCTSSQTYVGSIFVKKDNVDFIRMLSTGATSSTLQAFYNVSNGTLGSSGTPAKAAIEDYGNGWYRLSLIIDAVNTSSSATFRIQLAKTDGAVINNFDGTEKNLIWGAMLEQQSYPTSYIPTFGSTATRNGEVCNNSGSAQDFNSEEGVLYADIAGLSDASGNRTLSISDGTNNNSVVIRYTTTANKIQAFVFSGGVTQFSSDANGLNILDYNKVAISYKLNDVVLWVNGTQISTDTNATMPLNLSELNFTRADGANNFYGKTKNLKVFKRALTDTELEILTT